MMSNDEHLKLSAMRILEDIIGKANILFESLRNGRNEFEKDVEGYRRMAKKDKEVQAKYKEFEEVMEIFF